MKLTLTAAEKAQLLPHIGKVIETGNSWESASLHHPVEAIVKAILEIPGMKTEEASDPQYGIEGFSTNGWQWDWWQQFSCDGKRYTLSGSGYYGGHAFHLSDEQ